MSKDTGNPQTSQTCGLYFALGEDGRTPFDVGGESEFLRWWADGYGYQCIEETMLAGYVISTVFFGHAVHGADQLFETMICEDEAHLVLSDRKPELAVWRCATWDEAERQHCEACRWLQDYMGRQNFMPGL